MGVIFVKFRKEKSAEAVLEALQEKIDSLETFTVSTQEQQKRFVGNFLAVSIAVYVVVFVVFYFVYFPPTWKDRIVYCIPLLLFPLIIILLRYLFTWYFQRKLNKNSKQLAALKTEKKKILEQVMDKKTYKVAMNLLSRYADKPSKPSFALSPNIPNKPLLNRSLPNPSFSQRSQQLSCSTIPQFETTISSFSSPKPHKSSQVGATSSPTTYFMMHNVNQQLRRRTPFPIVNQREKGVFDRFVDVLIGDGPQDRFAMICKECYSHNGMALKDDFEYTTFKCAFCNALNPARKNRPVAPRLLFMPAPATPRVGSDTSDSEDDKEYSDDECMNLSNNTKQFSTPEKGSIYEDNTENDNNPASEVSTALNREVENANSKIPRESNKVKAESEEALQVKANSSTIINELLKTLDKSDCAIEDTKISPE